MMSRIAVILLIVSLPFWGLFYQWATLQLSNPQTWFKKRRFFLFTLAFLLSPLKIFKLKLPEYPMGKTKLEIKDVLGCMTATSLSIIFILLILSSVEII